jgi:chemotaxis protein methyltransferase CheR
MLPAADYQFLSRFVAERTGAGLAARKQFLLQARLVPLAQSWGLGSLTELIGELRHVAESPLGRAVIDLLTGGETTFDHDSATFHDLRHQILPQLVKSRRATRRLRIWSAATATGQEAYSLGMLLKDSCPELTGWTVEIFGTDASAAAIHRAATGLYSQTEVQLGLPIRQLLRWFQPADGAWQAKDDLRRMIRFQTADLRESFSLLGVFDVIVCRNVLGQLMPSERRTVLDRLSQSLAPDGYLLLGDAESLWGQSSLWDRATGCRSVAYTPSSHAPGRLRSTG